MCCFQSAEIFRVTKNEQNPSAGWAADSLKKSSSVALHGIGEQIHIVPPAPNLDGLPQDFDQRDDPDPEPEPPTLLLDEDQTLIIHHLNHDALWHLRHQRLGHMHAQRMSALHQAATGIPKLPVISEVDCCPTCLQEAKIRRRYRSSYRDY